MGHKREAQWFSLRQPAMPPDTAETLRRAVADRCSRRGLAACTPLPPAGSTMSSAPLLHRPGPERERAGGRGSAGAPAARCRAGESPGAAHSSGGERICQRAWLWKDGDGSWQLPSPVRAGLLWGGKRAPKDSVNSAALGAQAPSLSYPISIRLPPWRPPRHCPCATGWTGPPLRPPSCPTLDPATVGAGCTELLLGDTRVCEIEKAPQVPPPPQPTHSPAGSGVLEELTPSLLLSLFCGSGSGEHPQPSREGVAPCKGCRVSLCKGYPSRAGLEGKEGKNRQWPHFKYDKVPGPLSCLLVATRGKDAALPALGFSKSHLCCRT